MRKLQSFHEMYVRKNEQKDHIQSTFRNRQYVSHDNWASIERLAANKYGLLCDIATAIEINDSCLIIS